MPRAKAKPAPVDPLLPRPEAVLGGGTLTVPHAAEYTDLSESLLWELMAEGKLSYTNVSARRLIPRKSLLLLLAEQFVPGTR
jgi:hypothetical protein